MTNETDEFFRKFDRHKYIDSIGIEKTTYISDVDDFLKCYRENKVKKGYYVELICDKQQSAYCIIVTVPLVYSHIKYAYMLSFADYDKWLVKMIKKNGDY